MLAPDNPAASVPSLLAALTPAERLVAVHLVHGLSNKEISTLLGKAEPTVKHQVSSILRSANAQSRCQFIVLYYQHFLCPLPSGAMEWSGSERDCSHRAVCGKRGDLATVRK